jgi:superfamily II DNA or RNA helicase
VIPTVHFYSHCKRAVTLGDKTAPAMATREAGTLSDALANPEFHYQAEYKVLICKFHGLGVVGLESHLRDKHGLRTKKECRPILDRYAHLELAKPQNVAVPPADGPPFEALRVQRGFCCDECGHLSTSSKAIQGHCNTEHQWRVSRRDKTHWTEVKIQTFFEGFYLQYFTVLTEPAQSAGTNAAYDELRQKFLQGMKEGREKDVERKKILDAAMEKIDNTGWWTHTRWPLHFGDRHFGNIAHASRLPDRKERELLDAKTIVISMIKHAVDGLSLLHDDTPNWLRTANATNRVENRPMVRLQNVESLDTYINYWVRFMCYCLRVRGAQRKMEARDERRASGGDGDEDENDMSGGDASGEDEEGDDEGAGSDVVEAHGSGGVDTETGDGVEARDQQDDEEDEEVRRFKDCCELAKFTDEQKRLIDEMQESLDTKEGEATQKRKMMALSVSLIFQSIKGLDRFDSVMVHFGAVMGINEEGTNLLLGDRCSFKFAGFIYCIRVLFLEHVLPTSMRLDMTPRDIDHFLEMRAKYLVVGGYNPTGELIKWLGYGKIMSLQKINQPSITWTRSKENRPDRDILYLHGKPLPIRRFKSAIHDMISETEDILWRDLMWTERKTDRFTIDLSRIQDNLADVQRDGSFINNPANDLGGKEAWMFDRMTAAKRSKRLVGRDRTRFSMGKVREYRQMVQRLKRLMLVAMHMSGGPPGRGQEITPLRFRNGVLQARNFYVVDGRLIFVTRYHKSQAMFGEPKVIPRFIPWRLAQVFAVYLVYVQPWVEELDQQTNGLPRSDHLWHDKNGSWTTHHLTKALREETAIRMGQELTTSGYRHVAVEMGREYVGTDFMLHQPGGDEMLPEGEDVIEGPAAQDNAVDLAAAHTQAQAQRYGVRADIIRNLTDESLQVFGSICSRWHDFLGLDSRQPTWMKHSRGPSDSAMQTPAKRVGLTFRPYSTPANRPVMGSQSTDTSMGGSELVLGSQATSQQASSSQAIPTSRSTPASRLPLERSRLASRLELSVTAYSQAPSWTGSPPSQSIPNPWSAPSQGPTQEPAPWPSSPAGPASPPARFSGALMTPAGSSATAWTPSVNADRGVLPLTAPMVYSVEQVKRAMQTVLNQEEPEFRSQEQERAVAAVLNLDTPLVVVLPTGGGKTLPFMLAASLPDPGVTILVAPFSALLHDYVKRLKLSKVDHVVWHHGQTRYAPVVVVSADHSVCSDFLTYGHVLGKRLRRVVIDECHLTFTASEYRPKLRSLYHLRALGAPTVLLTATLPPTRVHELLDALSVQNPMIIRCSTVRPNIRYMVQRCPAQAQLKVACEMARIRRLQPGERGVFYCRSRDHAEDLAKLLRCGFFHSTSTSKEETIASWMEDGGFCAATGALGTGVDFPGIVYIVHVGVPYGMIDFAQETGRGGRSGEPVDSIVLLTDAESRDLARKEAAELSIDEMAMKVFLETKECRRLVMSGYLDEEGKTCADVEGRPCDHCGEGIADWTATQVRRAEEVQRVEQGLDEAQRHCGFCLVTLGMDAADHAPSKCSTTPGLDLTTSEQLRDGVAYDRRNRCKVCYKCGVSEQNCKAIEREEACRWGGVAAVLWLSWFRADRCREVLREGGFAGDDLAGFGRWLGFRAQAKVQGDVVSNGWWLLWTMLVYKRELCWGVPADMDEEAAAVVGAAGSRSPAAVSSPVATVDASVPEPAEEPGVPEVAGEAVVQDVIVRRQKLIQWLGQGCIYCVVKKLPGEPKPRHANSIRSQSRPVKKLPPDAPKHWHANCIRSQSRPDGCSYDEAQEFQVQMDMLREGRCHSCQKDIAEECGLRDTRAVTCEYADIMVHTVFMLWKTGWLEAWFQREGYQVSFGHISLQTWLNKTSDKGGVDRNRVVEAFDAYAMEIGEIG